VQEGHVLVTLDADFEDLKPYPPEESPGIIVLRMTRQDKPRILATIRRDPDGVHDLRDQPTSRCPITLGHAP
jgi:hypothetical protein